MILNFSSFRFQQHCFRGTASVQELIVAVDYRNLKGDVPVKLERILSAEIISAAIIEYKLTYLVDCWPYNRITFHRCEYTL